MSGWFIQNLFTDPAYYFLVVVLVMFSICAHEYSHAWMAAKRGDATAMLTGHMTMNPLKVMGTPSLVMLALFGIAWGAVPVNRLALRTRWNTGLVAFAGPGANLLLGGLFIVLAGFCGGLMRDTPDSQGVWQSCHQVAFAGASVNLLLFLFNMLPVPILDGYDVLAMFIPALDRWKNRIAGGVSLVFILLIFSSPLGGWIMGVATSLAGLGIALVEVPMTLLFGGGA